MPIFIYMRHLFIFIHFLSDVTGGRKCHSETSCFAVLSIACRIINNIKSDEVVCMNCMDRWVAVDRRSRGLGAAKP